MSITREALKAETKLGHIRKNAAAAEAKVKADWAAREARFVDGLPLGVRSILRAGGLLERKDLSASILDEPVEGCGLRPLAKCGSMHPEQRDFSIGESAEKPSDIETP